MLIKTLKTKLHRYFAAANTLTYLKALPLIVEQYNHTVHSSIQEKPVHVTPDNEYLIWNRLYKNGYANGLVLNCVWEIKYG